MDRNRLSTGHHQQHSSVAINAYLDLHDLRTYVAYVSARTSPDPTLLKPNSHLLTQALSALNIPPATATFFGDSTTDIQAAHAAGTMFIGYTNKPGKTANLLAAGAGTVIHTPARITKQVV